MDVWLENSALVTALSALLIAIITLVGKLIFDAWSLNFTRQLKLIDAQSDLLDELGDVLWDSRYAAMQVAYYGSRLDEPDAYEKAKDSYFESIWSHLKKIRTLGTRAGRLISATAPDRIEQFYIQIDDVCEAIEQAVRETDAQQRKTLFKTISPKVEVEIRRSIDLLIRDLATGVGLVPLKSLAVSYKACRSQSPDRAWSAHVLLDNWWRIRRHAGASKPIRSRR